MFDIFSKVKDVYDQIGVNFSATRTKMWPEILPFIKTIPQKAKVLDLACGNGRLIASLPEGVNYTGIDFSQTLLKEAKKKHPKHEFIKDDISNSNTWKGLKKYNVIFCLAALHHLPYDKQLFVLKQIKKHLVSNGKSLVTVWHLWQPKFYQHHLASWQLKFTNLNYLYIPFQGVNRPCYALSTYSLRKLASKAGFNNFKVETKGDNLLLTLGVN